MVVILLGCRISILIDIDVLYAISLDKVLVLLTKLELPLSTRMVQK